MAQLNIMKWTRGDYEISTDPARLDLGFVHKELLETYWSKNISRAAVETAFANSLVFGVYRAGGAQVGFARLVTDHATFAYLCDVVITPGERGRGLGGWLNECIVSHPGLSGLRRWLLMTKDAHGLYAKHGWAPLKYPMAFMERASAPAPVGGAA